MSYLNVVEIAGIFFIGAVCGFLIYKYYKDRKDNSQREQMDGSDEVLSSSGEQDCTESPEIPTREIDRSQGRTDLENPSHTPAEDNQTKDEEATDEEEHKLPELPKD